MRTGQVASLLAVLGVAACVESRTTACGDDTTCPANMECRVLVDPEPDRAVCVTAKQLAACGDAMDRSPCELGEGTGSVVGTCFDGACFPQVCGDQIVDVTEACDVGDRLPGDGCSANCLSREVCGDELVDLAIGEQCDQGTFGLSGDGCSSTCSSEYDVWRDVSPRHPGSRGNQALVRAPAGGVMIFGGTRDLGNPAPSTVLGDAWRWDGLNWSQLVSATAPPPARARASAAHDPARDEVLLFGGRDADGNALADLWRWNGVAWTVVTTAGTKPSPRWDASMACSSTRCIVHGGRNAASILGDTWVWDGVSWSELAGTRPSARARAALVHDPVRDVFVLFGGIDPAPRQDTWELAAQWTLKTTPVPPPAVQSPTATFDPVAGSILLGVDTETWTFVGGTWTKGGAAFTEQAPALGYDGARQVVVALGTSNAPLERGGGAWNTIQTDRTPGGPPLGVIATYLPNRGRTLVVEPTGTWEWDARSWRRVTVATPHPVPLNAGIAFDAACDRAVVFGGGAGASDQTWTYDGAWTHRMISAPPPRSLHAMTYDAKRDAVVVFGGLGVSSQALSDVWELRGPCTAKVWTHVPTTAGPSPRTSARLAFDGRRGVSVLFGGESNGEALNDTWEWDGAAWTNRTPTQQPPARSEHAMTFDPRRGAIVMFGGAIGASLLDDSWTWDGTAWTLLAPITSPSPRRAMTMTTDVTGRLVIFGGQGDAPKGLTDVWRLGAENNDIPTERCAVDGIDEDGDGLKTCADPDCSVRCAPFCAYGESCAGPRCGDGMCSPVEDYQLCPADCMAP